MKCPHCSTGIFWDPELSMILDYNEEEDEDAEEPSPFAGEHVGWQGMAQNCPVCDEPIIYIRKGRVKYGHGDSVDGLAVEEDSTEQADGYLIWPRSSARVCPSEVPHSVREDFEEAAEVLEISPKASAALSRRCLQHILREYAGTKKKDLYDQIEEVVKGNSLSSDLAAQLDAVRNIGNFAAHPQKSIATGEILPVEPQEAEWNLDILEELFDHYFVKPAQAKKRKEELNKKLAAVGKKLLP